MSRAHPSSRAARPPSIALAVLLALSGCTGIAGGGGTGNSGSAGGGDGGSGGGGGGGLTGCQPLAVEAGVTVDGYTSDRFTWYDGSCEPRSAALVPQRGFLRTFTYEVDGTTRKCSGDQPVSGWPGWGFVVSHYGHAGDGAHSLNAAVTPRVVFRGRHHAVEEFKLTFSPGGTVDVTIHWVFATGRSNPIYAITLAPQSQAVAADSRSPYGNLNFDGDGSGTGNVAGLGWGDRYRFRTTGSGPVTWESDWGYTQPNVVPHVIMWGSGADAEMGAVQTQTFDEHQGGGDYGIGSANALANCWSHTSASRGQCPKWDDGAGGQHVMLQDWSWPFQLNQYELPFGVTYSHRMAWGLSLGAVGQPSVDSFGGTISGYPYQSYSVFMVLGKHSAEPVEAQIAEVEVRAVTVVSATTGTVVTSGPGGVGRTDDVTFAQPGFDPAYAAWTFRGAGNALSARFQVAAGKSLPLPVIRVLGWTSGAAPARVALGGQTLTADADYFASVDAANGVLWLTLGRTLMGTADFAIE